ncbi:MAG: hypothetical protein ACKOEC_17620 [Acidimicrobiia bacterium]
MWRRGHRLADGTYDHDTAGDHRLDQRADGLCTDDARSDNRQRELAVDWTGMAGIRHSAGLSQSSAVDSR